MGTFKKTDEWYVLKFVTICYYNEKANNAVKCKSDMARRQIEWVGLKGDSFVMKEDSFVKSCQRKQHHSDI